MKKYRRKKRDHTRRQAKDPLRLKTSLPSSSLDTFIEPVLPTQSKKTYGFSSSKPTSEKKKSSFLSETPVLYAPSKETPCERRQARKEIIHATGNAGKTGQKPSVWKDSSYERC